MLSRRRFLQSTALDSVEQPKNVAAQTFLAPNATSGGRTRFEAQARSYTVIPWTA